MALGKVFEMNGLFKGPKRQSEPASGWRRLLNVWQDRTGKFRPKGEQVSFYETVSPYTDSNVIKTGFLKRFKTGVFRNTYINTTDATVQPGPREIFEFLDKDGNSVPFYYPKSSLVLPDFIRYTWNRNSYPHVVVGNKIFFPILTASQGEYLGKFDGYQVLRAGLPIPSIACAQYNTAGIVRYVRAIMIRIGFDGGLVSSGMLQFPVNNSTVTITTGTTSLVGSPQVSPAASPSFFNFDEVFDTTYDDAAFVRVAAGNAWSYASGTPNTWTCDLDLTVVSVLERRNVAVGQWVMFRDSDDLGTTPGFGYIYAMKVISFNAIEVVFDADSAKVYDRSNLTWLDMAIGSSYLPFTSTTLGKFGCSQQVLIYSSTTASGAYLLAATIPYLLNYSKSIVLTTSQVAGYYGGQVSTDLSAWYDVGTVKNIFPGGYRVDINTPALMGLTKYQGLLVAYDKNAIYYSDPTAGGSDEMISGFTNFVPLGSENGDIVCVEGCEDFILISRQRKNYVLVGDLSTGNFTISECDTESEGAFSSTSAISVKGGIVYVSRQGIFYVTSSGTISEISEAISRLFGASREFVTDPDNVSFKPYLMTDIIPASSALATFGWDGNLIRLKYDSDRNILGILYAKKAENPDPMIYTPSVDDHFAILAINLKNGAFYEWKTADVDGFEGPISDFEFMGKYSSLGKFVGSLMQSHDEVTREDATAAKVADRFMLTSWLVAEEPSLEKQAKQVKFYGQMTSCRIFHQENWEPFTTIAGLNNPNRTNVTYPTAGNQNTNLFEHKQRLNTSSPQAISIGFEPLDLNFSLEGWELEWDVRQESVKR